jgi:hypothetical protein
MEKQFDLINGLIEDIYLIKPFKNVKKEFVVFIFNIFNIDITDIENDTFGEKPLLYNPELYKKYTKDTTAQFSGQYKISPKNMLFISNILDKNTDLVFKPSKIIDDVLLISEKIRILQHKKKIQPKFIEMSCAMLDRILNTKLYKSAYNNGKKYHIEFVSGRLKIDKTKYTLPLNTHCYPLLQGIEEFT